MPGDSLGNHPRGQRAPTKHRENTPEEGAGPCLSVGGATATYRICHQDGAIRSRRPRCTSFLRRQSRINVYPPNLIADELYVMNMMLGNFVSIRIIKSDVITGG